MSFQWWRKKTKNSDFYWVTAAIEPKESLFLSFLLQENPWQLWDRVWDLCLFMVSSDCTHIYICICLQTLRGTYTCTQSLQPPSIPNIINKSGSTTVNSGTGNICVFPHTLLQNIQILSTLSGTLMNKLKVFSDLPIQYDKGNIQDAAIDIKSQVQPSMQGPNFLILLRHLRLVEELGA